MKTRSIKKDIAIIGMSGKFPKSENILEFWKNLVEGNELIHFYSDLELQQLSVNSDLIKNKKYVKNSAFLEDSGSFDYSFFGYTKEEAKLMDPQIRILHEQAWLSLEDSGYNPFNYSNKIGCFFSASDNLNWRAHVQLFENPNVNSLLTEQISNKNAISRLISYSLNLRGPSYFVDTACSSSLVAVHIACRSLLMKECSMALAGGVRISSSTNIGYVHEEDMIFSKDGHCKAFDIDSSGTVGGEGVGVVVLKRLEDALNDRDHIYSIIRSSSVNNDGSRKIGYTAPSIIGQYECIKSTHQIAEIDYKSISYIETHGTGTKLGDPVEVEALNKAFNYDTSHQCSIGSLKTNIGHLDAAAGVAGLIKTALSLHYKIIPPSLHFNVPNPEINFKLGPFYVNSELKQWVSEKSLLAGISSFGLGGTNAHAIIEEPPEPQKGNKSKTHELLVYSAKTKSSIERYQHKLEKFLEENKDVDLADLAYTLKTGRNNFKYRKFLVCENINDAKYQLSKILLNKPFQTDEKAKVVFMFAGQGSQYYKMGREIYRQYPYFKSIIDKGFEILKAETGLDYENIIGYNSNSENIENEQINDLGYSIPLLFLVEYAFSRLLLKFGIKPSKMIGHSFGEYVAACVSEVFTFEEGLKLIVKRAHLMNEIERGAMLSVDMSSDKVREFIFSDLSIAAINTENSCVVSGNIKSIDAFSETLLSKEINFIKIKTSHAGHSQMMESIMGSYEVELNKINFSEPKFPFLSCITGEPIKKEEAVSPKYWVNHLRQTVQFSKGLDFLLKEGNTVFIEIGSSKTLTSFLRQNKDFNRDVVLTAVLKHPKDMEDDVSYLLNSLGTLWGNGVKINWNEYYEGEFRNRISAPGYSFDKIIFPSKVDPLRKFIESNALELTHGSNEDYSEWIYETGWKEIKNEVLENVSFDWTICFLGDNVFSEKLMHELIKENAYVIFIKKGIEYLVLENNVIMIDPASVEDYERLSSEIFKQLSGTGRIIHAWCACYTGLTFDNNSEIENLGYFSLLNIARTFFEKKSFTSIHLNFLVNDLFKVYGNEHISSVKATALGALKVIPKEYENVHCKCIEFLMDDFQKSTSFRNSLFSKVKNTTDETTIALRGNKTWKPFYEKIKVDKESLEKKIKTNGFYVITGANGGMGKVLSEFLINEYNADLILIGRGEENKAMMSNLKRNNNIVHYVQDDLSDENRLKKKVEALMLKTVDGIFHAAGLGDYSRLIINRTREDCQNVFLPKVKGTHNVFNAFKSYSPDFMILCSSTAAVLAPFGQVAYVAANLYQNFFAHENNSKTKIISIQWDVWKDIGMGIASRNWRRGINSNDPLDFGISNKDGINLFKYALNSSSTEIIVSNKSINAQLAMADKHTLKYFIESDEENTTLIDREVERPDINTIYKEATSETEKVLCELWKDIFGYERIGINDNFFELGGNSLKVLTLIKRIHKSFNVEINIGDFFKKSNIEELAQEIDLALNLKDLTKSINQTKKSKQIRL